MAIIESPAQATRPQLPQKVYVARPLRGRIIVQRWPQLHIKPTKIGELNAIAWLTRAMAEYPFTDSYTVQLLGAQARKLHMRAKDLWTHILAQRAFLIITPDGKKWFPKRFLFKTSEALDTVAAKQAGLLVRGKTGWQGLRGGNVGATLTVHNKLPAWSDGTIMDKAPENPPAAQRISNTLDSVSQNIGSIMYRGEQWWEEIPIGIEGQVLRIGVSGAPEWQDP